MLYFPSIHFISTLNYYSKTNCVYKFCTKLLEKIFQIASNAGLFLHQLKGKISSYFEKEILTDLSKKKVTVLNTKEKEIAAASRFRDYYDIPLATSTQPLDGLLLNSKVYITDGETCPFDSIPEEVMFIIFTHFTPGLLGTVAQVSHKFHHLANDSVLWKLKYEEEFAPDGESKNGNWKIEFRSTWDKVMNKGEHSCKLQDSLSGIYQLNYGFFTKVRHLKYIACKKLGIPLSNSKRMKLLDSGRVLKDHDDIGVDWKMPKVINLQMIPKNMLKNY